MSVVVAVVVVVVELLFCQYQSCQLLSCCFVNISHVSCGWWAVVLSAQHQVLND